MDSKTLKVLDGSIAKWDAIVNGHGEDNGSENCTLCQAFECGPICPCTRCPVRLKTGHAHCHGTPYWQWFDHQFDDHTAADFPLSVFDGCAECLRLATAERDFLNSLRELH